MAPLTSVRKSSLVRLIALAVGGELCGVAGFCQSEYTAEPAWRVILVRIMATPYGHLVSALCGCVATGCRASVWRIHSCSLDRHATCVKSMAD